jgi:hypothetical protein
MLRIIFLLSSAPSAVEHTVSSAAQEVQNVASVVVAEVVHTTETTSEATANAVNDVSNLTNEIIDGAGEAIESAAKEVIGQPVPKPEEHHDSRTQEELEKAKIEQEQLKLAIKALEEELNEQETIETG